MNPAASPEPAPNPWRRPVRRFLRNWLERHQHPFSFAIHLIGIPLAFAGLAMFFFTAWYWALAADRLGELRRYACLKRYSAPRAKANHNCFSFLGILDDCDCMEAEVLLDAPVRAVGGELGEMFRVN